jgi:hypothetical protein
MRSMHRAEIADLPEASGRNIFAIVSPCCARSLTAWLDGPSSGWTVADGAWPGWRPDKN